MTARRFVAVWAGLAVFCVASWALLAFVVVTLARAAFR